MQRPPSPCLLLLALLLSAPFAPDARANDEALSLLTRGGGEIDPGKLAPGLLQLVGDEAFPLLRDTSGRVLAAGGEAPREEGGGRVLAFAHDGFLKSPELLGQPAVRELLLNAVRWCAGEESPEVALHPELAALAEILAEAGFKAVRVAPGEVSPRSVRSVYLTVAQRGFDEASIAAVLARLGKGAGLVVAATPWPFGGDHPDFSQFPANRLAAPAGLRFLAEGTASASKPYAVAHTDSAEVLAALDSLLAGPLPDERTERAAAAARLSSGAVLRGEPLRRFLGGLRQLNEGLGPIVPTPQSPLVPGADPLVDAVVALETEFDQSLPPGWMYPLPAASDYPGAVPDKAPRISRSLEIDGTWRGWLEGRGAGAWAAKEMRPTGLYAAPGEVLVVTAPPEIAGRGFEVVVGAYGGGLDGRDKWERYPRLQRAAAIEGPETRVSSALGGLVTLRVPEGADFGRLPFAIAGAVAAPLYVAGRTDAREWREKIRHDPAPWGELVGEHVILALPSRHLRQLEDPAEALRAWDEILAKAAELCGGVDRTRHRAERVVFERQPSAGYMHSGYPFAAPQDRSVEQAVDAAALRREGNWGFFHELGHNHQHDLWALPGTVETTCNLWSVYLFEEWVGKPREEGHDAIRPLDRRRRTSAYFEGGADFAGEWKVWTALETYLQVQEAFGWEPFKAVFAAYNALPEAERPKTQQEKNDQWVLRLSRACGANLAPHWAAWGLPLSESVHEALRELPAWTGPAR